MAPSSSATLPICRATSRDGRAFRFHRVGSSRRTIDAGTDASAPHCSVTEWRESVEVAVAARIETRPSMEAATCRLEAAVAAVWQQPQALLAELRSRVDVNQIPVSTFAQDLRQNPQYFGNSREAVACSAETMRHARTGLPQCPWPSRRCTTTANCALRSRPT